jgi:hypothetical protein
MEKLLHSSLRTSDWRKAEMVTNAREAVRQCQRRDPERADRFTNLRGRLLLRVAIPSGCDIPRALRHRPSRQVADRSELYEFAPVPDVDDLANL